MGGTVKRYMEEVGFKNQKHIQRLRKISPIDQRSRSMPSEGINPGSNPGGAISYKF